MDPSIPVRALHVLGVVLWIGGVAWQARGTTLLVGATGFHLTAARDLWTRFGSPGYWWMHWLLLTISLVTLAGAIAGAHGWVF